MGSVKRYKEIVQEMDTDNVAFRNKYISPMPVSAS